MINNDSRFRFLILYYLEDLWSLPIYDEIMESPNQEEVIRKYIAAWVQWDKDLLSVYENWRKKAGK